MAARTNLRTFLDFIGPRLARLLILCLLAGLGLFAAELAFAYILQAFLFALGFLKPDTLGLPAWLTSLKLLPILGLVFLVGALRTFLVSMQNYAQGVSQEDLQYLNRTRLLRWAFSSDSASTSDITTLFNARANAAGRALSCIQVLSIQVTCMLSIYGTLLWLSISTTLVLSAALLLLLYPLRYAERKIKHAGENLAEEWKNLNRVMIVSIKNLLLLQIYGTREQERGRAQSSLDAYISHMHSYYLINGLKTTLPQQLGLLLVCVFILTARSSQGMTPSTLVTYFYLFLRLLQMSSAVSYQASNLLFDWPQTSELVLWWQTHARDMQASAHACASSQVAADPLPAPVGWNLAAVGYKYPEAALPAVGDLGFSISPGSAVVITGPSGSGKSTLLNLLLGGISPQEGTIQVFWKGGAPETLAACKPRLLRSVGYVGPESLLIEGTIRENLAYGLQRSPDPQDLETALFQAECQFIHELPKGLDHVLSEQGQGLSAGQKQRLALARALLRDPRVLILDEATSNLDVETEDKLVDTFAHLKGRMTIIAATHRPAMLRIADQRIFLKSPEALPTTPNPQISPK